MGLKRAVSTYKYMVEYVVPAGRHQTNDEVSSGTIGVGNEPLRIEHNILAIRWVS